MSFLSNIFSATVKTVLTPVAIVKDVVNVATGEEPDATKELLASAGDDVSEATKDLADGNILTDE
jgi:hypothetical protein